MTQETVFIKSEQMNSVREFLFWLFSLCVLKENQSSAFSPDRFCAFLRASVQSIGNWKELAGNPY